MSFGSKDLDLANPKIKDQTLRQVFSVIGSLSSIILSLFREIHNAGVCSPDRNTLYYPKAWMP